jgi:hypothetical protein
MESLFARDFSTVRVHTGPRAAESAAAVNASAFTVGTSIVFGEGSCTSTPAARHRLLGHELAHVVQQGFTAPTPRGLVVSTDSAAEQEAEHAAAQVSVGKSAGELTTGTIPVMQREEASKSPDVELNWLEKGLIEGIAAPTRVMGSTAHEMVKATLRGFVVEVKTQAQTKGDQFWAKVKEGFTSPSQAASFVLHYWWGLVKGVLSPITGLFDLAKLVVKLELLQSQILATAWTRREELAAEAGKIAGSMGELAMRGRNAIEGLKKNPSETVKALGSWFSSLEKDAVAAAESGGRKAGGLLMSQLDKPLPELGESAGEIVGMVLINIVLLVFTEGIGNAIAQVATKLGEFGAFLGKFGKVAQMLGKLAGEVSELLGTIGGWIAKAEAAFAKAAETVLKPLSPLLEEFGKLVSGLRSFLRKLLGVSEEAAGAATEQFAGAAARNLEGHVPPSSTAPAAELAGPKVVPPSSTAPAAELAGPKVVPPLSTAPAAELAGPKIVPPLSTAPAAELAGPKVVPPPSSAPAAELAGPKVAPPSSSAPAAELAGPKVAPPPSTALPAPAKPAEALKVEGPAASPTVEKQPAIAEAEKPPAETPVSEKPAPKPKAVTQSVDEMLEQRAANNRRIGELDEKLKELNQRQSKLGKKADEILERRETSDFRERAAEKRQQATKLNDQKTKLQNDRNRLTDENERIRNEINRTKIGPPPGQPHGGAHSSMEAWDGERNHIPPQSITGLSEGKGPAIWMEKPDHLKTKSWGSGPGPEEWRATQKKLIDQGRLQEAVQMDIDDIRKQFGTKYDKGIQEMLDYMKTLNPIEFKSKY